MLQAHEAYPVSRMWTVIPKWVLNQSPGASLLRPRFLGSPFMRSEKGPWICISSLFADG